MLFSSFLAKLTLALTQPLQVSIGAPALTEGNNAKETDILVLDKPEIGFNFVTPEKDRNLKGALDRESHYLDDGILQIPLFCYAFPEKNYGVYKEFVNAYYNAFPAGQNPRN